ncbi:MAG TPA: hypothetical protein VN598_14520 [Usitatibacter sp.]|nr:hypothetical protein [Usitatibacter sp.]
MNTIDSVLLFAMEVAACLALSALVVVRLNRLLRRIGAEVCERGGASTEFWIAYTQLMMFVAPLLLVAYFSRAGFYYRPVQQLQSSLFLILLGQFVGLVLVGRAVWKTINPTPATAPTHPRIAPVPSPEPKAEAA